MTKIHTVTCFRIHAQLKGLIAGYDYSITVIVCFELHL